METIINPSNPKETITYNRIGGTPENPIYFNDALKPTNQPAVITPQSLAPAPKVNVPNVPTTSPTEVLTTVPERAKTDIEQARLEAERIQQAGGGESERARNTLLESVRSLFGDRASALGQQATAEEQAGIGEQRKILNEVNSQIAEQNIALRAEQERIRTAPMSAAQKQIEINAIENDYGRRLADLAIRQSAARGNIEGIQQDAERKTKLLLAPIDNQIEYFKTFGLANVEALSKKEQDKLQLIVTNLQNKRKEVQDLQKAKTELITEISNNGGGSSQFISQINGASTLEDAYAIAAKSGYIGKLDRQVKQAQLSKIYADIAKDKVQNSTSVNVAQIKELQGLPASVKTNLIITEYLKGNKIGQGTRTNLANTLGVINAAKELADARQTSSFTGISPLNAVLDIKVPFTNVGLPFRNAAMTQEAVENRQYLEAINLKVQQWASGASLTKQQTEQVDRFTPRPTDTDEKVRTKLNGLVNFLNTQVQSALQSEGIDFKPEKIDLFEIRNSLKSASPEQLQELKDARLIQ